MWLCGCAGTFFLLFHSATAVQGTVEDLNPVYCFLLLNKSKSYRELFSKVVHDHIWLQHFDL